MNLKKYRKYIRWSLWALLVLVVVRLSLYQVVPVRDYHMASTLLPGDRVLVNKVRAGLRMPISIIGLPGPGSPYVDGVRLPYMRLPALRKIARADVIVYNYPIGADKPLDRKRLNINRVVGLPFDTVFIQDKIVMVNNQPVTPPAESRFEYRVVTDGGKIDPKFIRKYSLDEPRVIADVGIFDLNLPAVAFPVLEKEKGIRTVRETHQFREDPTTGFYPGSGFFRFNRDQFGPLKVPGKGMQVEITIQSIDFYRPLIETHEGHSVMVDFRGVHIDDELVTSYTFRKDYYFVLSDNRDDPSDSRVVGFVPADHILGVTRRVIWSQQHRFDHNTKFKPGRFFRRIR
jgi:signal peptidase I